MWQKSCSCCHLKWKIVSIGKVIISFRITWGNPDQGKLGHPKKVPTAEEIKAEQDNYKRRGYSPKNFADYNEMNYVSALDDKVITDVACGY